MPNPSVLCQVRVSWDTSSLPGNYSTWKQRMMLTDLPNGASPYHDASKTYVTLWPPVIRSLLAYCAGSSGEISAVKIADKTYATEQLLPNGETGIFYLAQNGTCKGTYRTPTGRHQALPQISRTVSEPLDFVYFAALLWLCDEDPAIAAKLEEVRITYDATGELDTTHAYYLSDALYYALRDEVVKVLLPGGNADVLTQTALQTGALTGSVVCGTPQVIMQPTSSNASQSITYETAEKEFESWRAHLSWTQAEEALIPKFPSDFLVPKETLKIARRYLQTRTSRRPMNNFMWRGVTSYGKSTGVEILAALLHTPLLRMTCHTSMETADFLSSIVPCGNDDLSFTGDFPSFSQIELDPEGAYQILTGENKPDVTGDEILAAYGKAVLAKHDPSARPSTLFKQVESNFVKALSRGYILEVQEISRIKDSGVLVGINEYDHAGAVIPLVNGGSVRRHPDALVVYTDNVGYVSCRPVDPSVLRRMAFIIDSYDLPKEEVLKRIVYNTGFNDANLLEQMYEVFCKIQDYCADRDITEGTLSATELEMWAQTVMADGYANIQENCQDCVISKATSVISEQKAIKSEVLAVHLNV